MGDKSKIEWTDATWNPVTGCTKVSPGCKHCYAEVMAGRLQAMGQPRYRDGFRLTLQPDVLGLPLRWQRPRRIFVDSMSDLFHDDVPDEYIQRVFATMVEARRHTFQVLTKRSERLRALAPSLPWPDNVWMGVTVEDQDRVSRIDDLSVVTAAVRFLSCEPLLGPLDIGPLWPQCWSWPADRTLIEAKVDGSARRRPQALVAPGFKRIDWVISGGESGPKARPSHPAWFRALRDQCVQAGVKYHHKQNGCWVDAGDAHERAEAGLRQRDDERVVNLAGGFGFHGDSPRVMRRVDKHVAGRLLDGREWNEFPKEVTRA